MSRQLLVALNGNNSYRTFPSQSTCLVAVHGAFHKIRSIIQRVARRKYNAVSTHASSCLPSEATLPFCRILGP
eukprot:3474857-Pleurochrysis_carterae.AAC.1